MNPDISGTGGERKIAPVYVILNNELTIDAPIEKVWRHMIDYSSWQNYSVREHVSGEPGQEGEVVLLKKEEKEYVSAPYFARTIKIDPGRRIVWKTYRDTPDYFGIVDFRLYDSGGKTRFCTNNLYEFLVPYRHESELEAFRKERYALSEAVFAATHARLKALAEAK
jgi:uncharacterized protein YndB with AHSA1/START domain